MNIDLIELKKILEDNPQVDANLLAKALKEAEGIESANDDMVNFNLRLPYASDDFERSIQNAWDVISPR